MKNVFQKSPFLKASKLNVKMKRKLKKKQLSVKNTPVSSGNSKAIVASNSKVVNSDTPKLPKVNLISPQNRTQLLNQFQTEKGDASLGKFVYRAFK